MYAVPMLTCGTEQRMTGLAVGRGRPGLPDRPRRRGSSQPDDRSGNQPAAETQMNIKHNELI